MPCPLLKISQIIFLRSWKICKICNNFTLQKFPGIRYVRCGMTIYTDLYDSLDRCGYVWLARLYVHGMVNHFQNFVDPVTGVHTNSIEGTWTHAKKLKTTAQVRICLGRTWWRLEYMWRRYRRHFSDTYM